MMNISIFQLVDINVNVFTEIVTYDGLYILL